MGGSFHLNANMDNFENASIYLRCTSILAGHPDATRVNFTGAHS